MAEFNISGRMSVERLQKQFKEEFGLFKKDTSLISNQKDQNPKTKSKKKVIIEFDN